MQKNFTLSVLNIIQPLNLNFQIGTLSYDCFFVKCSAAPHRLNHQFQSSVTGKHPTVRFDTWKGNRLLLIIPAYEKARMIRKRISNHPGF